MEIIGGRGPYINCLVNSINFSVFLYPKTHFTFPGLFQIEFKESCKIWKMLIEVNMTIWECGPENVTKIREKNEGQFNIYL